MSNLPAGDSTTQWTIWLKANAAGGEVMKLMRAALKTALTSTREDSSTLWRLFHKR